MSTTVDSKVVQMQFDNKQFESGVQTSIASIESLKKSLNFDGVSKGFESLGSSVQDVDMTGLGGAVETVKLKFSALQVMAVTALQEITRSAYNAGKNILKSLTIDPIMAGFDEYETQINAIQTIMANTSSKGTTMEQVNEALDTLNAYADKTIYNFTEMTRNIGTFTATGVDLDTSVQAIQGIANLAAVSGSTSQQASTAMYQLSQALASGSVKLQDWNSVVNAGMGGEVFQNALKETAKVHGINVDKMIEEEGSFRDTMKRGWITTEILTETLAKFTMAAEEGTEQWDAYKKSLKEQGYTEEQAEEILKMANTATDAATKVKTFSQLFDTLKEAAQSGWTQTWEILIGDFEEAKDLFTKISDFIGGFINNMSEARNSLLEAALGGSPLSGLADKISGVTKATGEMSESLENYDDVVSSVIRGDWGNMQARWDALTEAGYDWAKVQNLVNEKLGSSVRYSSDLADANSDLEKSQAITIEQLLELSDAQLLNMEFTQQEIDALRELSKEAKATGKPIEELMGSLTKPTGRELLLESLGNIFGSLIKVFQAFGDAYREIFPPMSADSLYGIIEGFHSFTEKIKLSDETADKIKRTFKGIFAVLDIGVTIVKTIASGFFKLIGVVTPAGGGLLSFVLGITATIGDVLVGVRDAFDKTIEIIDLVISKVADGLSPVVQRIKDFGKEVKDAVTNFIDPIKSMSFGDVASIFTEGFSKLKDSVMSINFETVASKISEAISNVKDTLSSMSLDDFKEIGKNLIDGLINGIKEKLSIIKDTVVEFCTKVIEFAKDVFGIHSPSTVFKEIGEFIIEGLKQGLEGISDVVTVIFDGLSQIVTSFFDGLGKLVESFKGGFSSLFGSMFGDLTDVDLSGAITSISNIIVTVIKALVDALGALINDGTLSTLFDLILDGIIGYIGINIGKLVSSITGITDGVGDMISPFANLSKNISDLFEGLKTSLTGFIDSMTAENKSIALMNVAKALIMLAAAVAVLSFIDGDSLTSGLLVLGTLMTELGIFMKKSGLDTLNPKVGGAITLLAIGLLLLTGVIGILGNMDPETVIVGLAAIGATLYALGKGLKQLPDQKGLVSTAFSIGILAGSLLIMSGVIAILGNMDLMTLGVGIAAISSTLSVIGSAMNKLDEKGIMTKAGALIVISLGLIVMAGAVALMGSMDVSTLAAGIIAFGIALAGLDTAMNNLDEKGITTKAGALVVISAALIVMAGAVALMGSMDLATIAKGLIGMAGALTAIVLAMNNMESDGLLTKAGALIIVSTALIVLAGALALMGSMDLETIGKGLLAMGGALAELVIALNLMKGTVEGAAAMMVAVIALGLLTPILITLGTFALVAAAGLLVIAGAFTVLGVAGLVLSPLVPVITALSASIVSVGVGCLAAGAGLLLFATALTSLAITGKAGGDVLIAIFTDLIMLIPLIFAEIGLGLIALCATIIAAVPYLVEAIVVLVNEVVLGLIAIIVECIPPIMDTLGMLLDELILFIYEYGPKIIELGVDLIVMLLTGIRDSICNIVLIAAEIIASFVLGLGLCLGSIVAAAIQLIIDFVNAISQGVRDHALEIGSAAGELVQALLDGIVLAILGFFGVGEDVVAGLVEGLESAWHTAVDAICELGSDIWNAICEFFGIHSPSTEFAKIGGYLIDGLVNGIKDCIWKAVDAAKEMASDVWDSVCDFLGINSPSRKFIEVGKFIDQGLAKGLEKFSTVAEDSATDVGDATVESMSKSLSHISDIISDDIDSQPTIRPVLDLSEVEAGTSQLNTMFSRTQAMKVNSEITAARNGKIQNGDESASNGNTYQFTQNNYSPKALSRIEIYRQTKNQFSTLKGVT